MEIKEYTGLFNMDTGCPLPHVIAREGTVTLLFMEDRGSQQLDESLVVRAECSHILIMKFKHCKKHIFGGPNDETLSGHRYYRLGLRSYGFYTLENSDLLASMKIIDKVHPYYKDDYWAGYNHYILTFHDSMFECVASGFEIIHQYTPFREALQRVLEQMSV